MTDIEICQRKMLYPIPNARAGASAGLVGRSNGELNLQRTKTMTIEIFYLAAQIQRWLNQRVARHLEAQAAKFTR